MKMDELKTKSIPELNKLLHETLEQLFKLRMQRASGQLKTTHQLPQLRHTVARIKAAMTEIR